MGRRAWIVGTAALALAMAAPGVALADQVPRGLTLRYSPRKEAFTGRLTKVDPSAPDHCFVHQPVAVYKRRRGQDLVLGLDRTNARQRYRVPFPERRGRYYAQARRTTRGDDTCLAVKTKTLTIA